MLITFTIIRVTNPLVNSLFQIYPFFLYCTFIHLVKCYLSFSLLPHPNDPVVFIASFFNRETINLPATRVKTSLIPMTLKLGIFLRLLADKTTELRNFYFFRVRT